MILNIADWSRGGSIQSYTGNMTESNIISSGKIYRLYTLTGSGTFSVKGKVKGVDIWLCGGGSNGTTGSGGGGTGGAGAYCAQSNDQVLTGSYTVTIGSASAVTSFGTLLTTNAVSGASGGTGGGGSGGEVYWATDYETAERLYYNQGSGDGKSKYPFLDSHNFYCHCAGGGGGAFYERTPSQDFGACDGTGGTNGGSGSAGSIVSYSGMRSFYGGSGGNRGGGSGGGSGKSVDPSAGSSASFYGSGGGGGGYYGNYSNTTTKAGGAGYQGVCYVRVPYQLKASVPYKYYRVSMTAMKRSNSTGTYFSIAELKFYNASSEEISTTGATFTASSSLSGYPVSNAFDGSNSTLWHVDGSPSSAWLQIQYPSATSISAFSITPRSDMNDRLDAFTLQASNNGSTWTVLYTGSDLASNWSKGTTKLFIPD